MLRNKLLFLPIMLMFFVFSCENSVDNAQDKPVSAEPTQEIVANEAHNVATLAFTGPVSAYQDYKEILETENDLSKVNGDKVYRWNPETGWHTWEDDLAEGNDSDAFSGHYKRGQQFFNAQGQIVKKAEHAVGLNFYYTTSGHYGYVDGGVTGTSWDHAVEGSAAIVNGVLYFTGNGQYHKIWDGYYSSEDGAFDNDLVRFETVVNVDIEEMIVSPNEDGGEDVTAKGTVMFEMLPWSAEFVADGSDTVSGVLKYQGQPVQELSFSAAELLAVAKSLKP